MTAARLFILAALQRVIDGGDIGEAELAASVPDPFALGTSEKKAWEELGTGLMTMTYVHATNATPRSSASGCAITAALMAHDR